jgi:spore coat polysaccharide biosynthesis protein SpsF
VEKFKKNINIVCVIQCRTGSTRLKKKSIKKLGNYSIIEWVVRRVKKSKKINEFYLATTKRKEDDCLVKIAKKLRIKIYRGSANNVFERFSAIARKTCPNYIIRVCADNPFIHATEIDKLISKALRRKSDYIFNHVPYKNNNYIDGLGAECLSSKAITKLIKVKKNRMEKEHVTKYIWNNKKKFRFNYFIATGISRDNNRKIKLDIDYPEEYKLYKSILKNYKDYPENLKLKFLIKKLLISK